MDRRIYWIWLQGAIEPGSPLKRLMERFGHAEEIYKETSMAAFSGMGYKPDKLDALLNKDLTAAKQILDRCEEAGYGVLTPGDPKYPKSFQIVENYPAAVYTRGEDLDYNRIPMISIVGTRKASEYSMEVASRLSFSLAKGNMTVISGGALGVDTAAHQGAMLAGGKTVGILGCGLDSDYLKENAGLRDAIAKHGALLTEYPPEFPASRTTFPIRNRLIAALGLGTVVIEASIRSGSLITARYANELGKTVFAVPGSILKSSYAGVNGLIRDGACMVTSAQDVLEEYHLDFPDIIDLKQAFAYDIQENHVGKALEQQAKDDALQKAPVPVKKAPPAVTGNEKLVYDTLRDAPKHVNDICESTGLRSNEVLSALSGLEFVHNAVKQIATKVFAIKEE